MFERRRLHVIFALLALLASPALADEAAPTVVMIPANCLGYWVPQRALSTNWDRMLSLAACIQDTSVEAIDDAADLPGLVDRLGSRLLPSLSLYATAVQNGPGPVRLRAIYQIGMAEVSLMIRARASVRSPEQRARLVELLEPNAVVALLAFAAVVQVAHHDPTMAPDAVTRFMVSNSRELLEQLATDWGTVDFDGVQLASPEPRAP